MTARDTRPTKLLVPLDGSPLSEQSLPYVRMLGTIFPTQLHLLRVVDQREIANLARLEAVMYYSAGDTMEDARSQERPAHDSLISDAQIYLDTKATLMEPMARHVTASVSEGMPEDAIATVADAQHCDMIVMVTHGYGGLRRWAMGSVTWRVINHTMRPVLMIRGQAEPPEAEKTDVPRRIMVPLDGTHDGERALEMAAKMARASKAEILLVHVVEPMTPILPFDTTVPSYIGSSGGELNDELRERAYLYLEDVADRFRREHDLKVSTSIPVGHVAEELVDETDRKRIDMIVMATHGSTGMRRLLGSTAEKVIQAVQVPLLAIPCTKTATN
jgi:nucleotide-binding universal stress UspA family protein